MRPDYGIATRTWFRMLVLVDESFIICKLAGQGVQQIAFSLLQAKRGLTGMFIFAKRKGVSCTLDEATSFAASTYILPSSAKCSACNLHLSRTVSTSQEEPVIQLGLCMHHTPTMHAKMAACVQ